MTNDQMHDEYFEWMCNLISTDGCPNVNRYQHLLNYLDSQEFIYILDMDGNRYADGVDLRYRFGHEKNYHSNDIAIYLDDHKCTIFEMMVALAFRCEEQIMSDPDIGNRTGLWFWGMIKNLGLDHMTDSRFSKLRADKIIDKFLYRTYGPNGDGGLFTINDCKYDLREIDIWYQMLWYLNTIIA